METIYLKKEEIDELKSIQEKENEIIFQIGQLEYQILNLQSQKNEIQNQLVEFNKKRNSIAQKLQDNYGEGSVNLESGEFIKNS